MKDALDFRQHTRQTDTNIRGQADVDYGQMDSWLARKIDAVCSLEQVGLPVGSWDNHPHASIHSSIFLSANVFTFLTNYLSNCISMQKLCCFSCEWKFLSARKRKKALKMLFQAYSFECANLQLNEGWTSRFPIMLVVNFTQ